VTEVIEALGDRKAGQRVVIVLRRAGKTVEVQATLGKRPAPEKKDDDE
jgi:S1-C subfamily serine protease